MCDCVYGDGHRSAAFQVCADDVESVSEMRLSHCRARPCRFKSDYDELEIGKPTKG